MSNPIFDELDHRLSVVKRWGILHTLQNQSVAEHVHNVVRITLRIGVGWFKLSGEELFTALLWAHHHDDPESLTGDMPTMSKPWFDEGAFIDAHKDLLDYTVLPPQHIVDIVKLADKMEGYYFLAMENALGNQFSYPHFQAEFHIIETFAGKIWGPGNIQRRVVEWMKEVGGPRSTRHSRRGR